MYSISCGRFIVGHEIELLPKETLWIILPDTAIHAETKKAYATLEVIDFDDECCCVFAK
jgi:hypothetical protein